MIRRLATFSGYYSYERRTLQVRLASITDSMLTRALGVAPKRYGDETNLDGPRYESGMKTGIRNIKCRDRDEQGGFDVSQKSVQNSGTDLFFSELLGPQHVIRFGRCHRGRTSVHANPSLSLTWTSQFPQVTKHGDSTNQERGPVSTLDSQRVILTDNS